MLDEENIAALILQVDEIVNTIQGLSEEFEESIVAQKILRSLLDRFNSKVSTIEEMKDLDKLSVDELHEILASYEMRISKEDTPKGELSFQAIRRLKEKKPIVNKGLEEDTDKKEALFVQKIRERKKVCFHLNASTAVKLDTSLTFKNCSCLRESNSDKEEEPYLKKVNKFIHKYDK